MIMQIANGDLMHCTTNKCCSEPGEHGLVNAGTMPTSNLVRALGSFTMLFDISHFLVRDPGKWADNPMVIRSMDGAQ